MDSVICVGDKLYSGGDKRIMVSDIYTGQVLHQVTRDTGSIPLLDKFENSLICCSASGAIRFFGLVFNVKRMKLVSLNPNCGLLSVLTSTGIDNVGTFSSYNSNINGISFRWSLRDARYRRARVFDVYHFGG